MPTSALDLSFLRLSYREDLQLLFLRWTRPVSPGEHRAGYEQALELAAPRGAGRWLVDLRSRGLAEAEDFSWVLTDFRREMTQALPGATLRVAYLVTPYHQELINSRLPADEVLFATFTEEQAASQWLSRGQ
jgi:hypothetical protein